MTSRRLIVLMGLAVAAVDLIVILGAVLTDVSGGALHWLTDVWVYLHDPVTTRLMPALADKIPSHGGGGVALAVTIIYYSACLVYAFIVGLIIGAVMLWGARPWLQRIQ